MSSPTAVESSPDARRPLLERLLARRAEFQGFLSARVGHAAAEDILQSAYIKALEHGAEIRENESSVAWFYRLLRNSATDHFRRQAARTRAHESFAAEAPVSYEQELQQTACACIGGVLHDLKPEYREAIEQVDLGNVSVDAFAQTKEISANNASVRLHRARKALARELMGDLWSLCRAQVHGLHVRREWTVRFGRLLRQQL